MEVRILIPPKLSAKLLDNKKKKAFFDYESDIESGNLSSSNSSDSSESANFPSLKLSKRETYSPPHLRKRRRNDTIDSENLQLHESNIVIIANEYFPKGTKISTVAAGEIQIVQLERIDSVRPLAKDDIRYRFDGFEKVLTNTSEENEAQNNGVEKKVLVANWIRFLKSFTNRDDPQVNTIARLNMDKARAPYVEFLKDVSPGTRLNVYFEIPHENCNSDPEKKISQIQHSMDEVPLDLSGTINQKASEKGLKSNRNQLKTQNLTPFLIRNVLNEKVKTTLSPPSSNNETPITNYDGLDEDLDVNVHSPENSNSSSNFSSPLQKPDRKFEMSLNNSNQKIKEKSNINISPFAFTPFSSGLSHFQGNVGRHSTGPATAILRPILRTRGRERSLLPCDVCGKAFDRPSLLKRHMRTHTGEKPHVCDVCSKGFSTSSSLNTHRRIHSGEKPHQCPICGKRFTASSNLYYHRMTHNKEKPHKCGLCGKSFPTPGDLKSHQYVHSGSWPYNCPVCHRGFSKQTNLRNHLLLHSGDKPHTCSSCGKKFALACNLRAHLRTHDEELTISCINCKRSFLTSQNIVKNGLCRPCTGSQGKSSTNDQGTLSEVISKQSSPELQSQNIYSSNPHILPFTRPQVNNPNEMSQNAISSLFGPTGFFPRVIPSSFQTIPQANLVQPITNSLMRQPMNQFLEHLVEWNWRCAKETGNLSAGIMHQMIAAQLMSNNANTQSLQVSPTNSALMLNDILGLNRVPGATFPVSFPLPEPQLNILRNSKK